MGQTPALMLGIVLLVILGRLPFIGWFIYLLSFILAVGGLVQASRRGKRETAPAAA
jgi:hypothetical protein